MVHKLIILQWACGLVWVTHMVKMLSLSYTAVALHTVQCNAQPDAEVGLLEGEDQGQVGGIRRWRELELRR